MDPGTLLNDRYRIQAQLGERRHATTFLAIDERTSKSCVVKQLSVGHAYREPIQDVGAVSGSDAAKLIELFEREGRVLAHLDHPRVPKLVDHFTVESDDDTRLYLVQERIGAQSLAQLAASGRHFTERETVRIAFQVAGILEYLHGRSPPLIHRDIKPSNILYGDQTGAFLVDFGAVKDRLARSGLDGSTVVGTYDYMPLEQYQGNAVPATDIYSLGVTLIAVLSHVEPSDIARQGTRLDFRPHVHVSPRFADILEKMVEPTLERRYRSASELKKHLAALLAGRRPVNLVGRLVPAAGVAVLALLTGAVATYVTAASEAGDVEPPRARLKSAAEETPAAANRVEAPAPVNDPIPPVGARNGVLRLDIFEDFKYVNGGWPMGLSVAQTGAGGVDRRPYEDLRTEPVYRSRQRLYGYIPLGNGPDTRITFVIDELDRPTWILYVDKNNNEDLTDDGPPHQNQGTGRLATTVSLTVELVTPSGETIETPYNLWLWVNERAAEEEGGQPRLMPRFYTRCHYKGRVELGGQVFDAVAYEFDRHNALFAENGIWIDLNGDGELEDAEHFSHGDAVRVGGEVYRIELAYP